VFEDENEDEDEDEDEDGEVGAEGGGERFLQFVDMLETWGVFLDGGGSRCLNARPLLIESVVSAPIAT